MLVTVLSAELSATVTLKRKIINNLKPGNLFVHLLRLNHCEHVGKYSGVHGEIKQSTINQNGNIQH